MSSEATNSTTAAAHSLRTTLDMIKIEHTLFALPFALLGAVLAARGLPALWQLLWITVAMVGARSAAMAFNRIADHKYDAANPRTSGRAIPAGALSLKFAWTFTLASAALFFVAAFMLNRLTLLLAPVALASVLFYSYTKRFTSLSHLVLGWCLAIAPTGAWIAVRGALDSPVPLLLSLVVLLWTAGFDVLYACQDYDFDRAAGLRSIPARLSTHASPRRRSQSPERRVLHHERLRQRHSFDHFRRRGLFREAVSLRKRFGTNINVARGVTN